MPISIIRIGALSEVGIALDATAARPIAENTEVSPSSTGRPAASSAPNATTRISSVIGIDSRSALAKSLDSLSSRALPADAPPNCSTRTPGCAARDGGDGLEHRRDPGRGVVGRAADRELDLRRAAVGRALGGADRGDVGDLAEPGADVAVDGVQRGVGQASLTGLHEHELRGGLVVEAGLVEHPRGVAGLAGAARVLVDLGGADGVAGGEAHGDERDPGEDRAPRVQAAPAAHAVGEIAG
jgi:hypothetical protein